MTSSKSPEVLNTEQPDSDSYASPNSANHLSQFSPLDMDSSSKVSLLHGIQDLQSELREQQVLEHFIKVFLNNFVVII